MKKIVVIVFWALIAGILVVALLHPTRTPPKEAAPTPVPIARASYACDAGKTVTAAFFAGKEIPSTPGEPPTPTGSAEITLSDGRTLKLAQTISADGGRYANADESFVFWSKGNGALVLENDRQEGYTGCITVVADPGMLPMVYHADQGAFSLRYPEGFTVDPAYVYQLAPGKTIQGVKFTIPQSLKAGTNLSSDSYVSVESLPNAPSCTAALFLDGTHTPKEITEHDTLYSVADASNAGAGNRYDETVYALAGTNPCVAVRYFIHYTAVQNYPPGMIKEFDRAALLAQFDALRATLTLN